MKPHQEFNMKYYYEKKEYSDLIKRQNSKLLIIVIVISVITIYLYLDFIFIKAITPQVIDSFSASRESLQKDNLSLERTDLTNILSLTTVFVLIVLVFSVKKIVISKPVPKSLSDIIKQNLLTIQIISNNKSQNKTKNEVVRILLNNFYLDLSWYNISGPHHKWKIKLGLHTPDNNLNSVYTFLADVLLLEEEIDNNSNSFSKIILAKELPRHLITINYWIGRLNLSKKA
ncbi:MAG: hypothetical protein HeimC3_10860 [Candidatus Heimdallarchaeota archaeon LC_3]|nr:MAG: hypothetical protein HeimC3_10860 [Candidatus Heimdallarchaeota archaeon LC_3]